MLDVVKTFDVRLARGHDVRILRSQLRRRQDRRNGIVGNLCGSQEPPGGCRKIGAADPIEHDSCYHPAEKVLGRGGDLDQASRHRRHIRRKTDLCV